MSEKRPRPVHQCLAHTKDVRKWITSIESVPGTVIIDDKYAGTVEAKYKDEDDDEGEIVFLAIQKGREPAPWICMFYNAGPVSWGEPTP